MADAKLGTFRDLPVEEPYPGLRRSSFDCEGATVTSYVFEPGARFPLHRHPQEQITIVEEGEVEFTWRDETRRLRAGEWSVVGPDVEHGIRATETGAKILAVIVPRRASSTAYTVVGPEP